MRDRILIAIILVCTFGVFFLLTTWITDSYDHHSGYYRPGLQESAEVWE